MHNRNFIIIETKITKLQRTKRNTPQNQKSQMEMYPKLAAKSREKFNSCQENSTKLSVASMPSIQGTVDMVKRSSVVPADASPYHNRATSKGDHFLDSFGFKVLPWTPPHTGMTITRCKTEAAFISEQSLCQLGMSPPLVCGAPGMVPCQHGFSYWTTCTKPDTMESITYCLRTDCGLSGS